MKLPLCSLAVIDLGGERWVLNGNRITPITRLNDLSGPIMTISDFGASLQRTETVIGEKRHAEAIIEKQLRDRGDSDGPSKVLIVDSENIAGTTHALYTSVPADKFSEYWTEVSEQKDHCLLVPVLALLYRRLLSFKTSSIALVFQSGLQLTFLTVKNGKPQHCLQVSSTSLLESDWTRTVGFLVSKIRLLPDVVAEKIEWHSWNVSNNIDDVIHVNNIFAKYTNFQVYLAKQVIIYTPVGKFSSSIHLLLKSLKISDNVNGAMALSLFKFEQYLPWAVALVLGATLAVFTLSEQWNKEVIENRKIIASLNHQIDEEKLTFMTQNIKANSQSLEDLLGLENLSLLNILTATNNKPSLPEIILNIRQSVPSVLKITGIRLDSFLPDIQVTLEGNAGNSLSEANVALELMINTLRGKGYNVLDNGMSINNNNNLFQLVLTLKGNSI